MSKFRLSAALEGELVGAGRRAVAEGRAYEAEHGVISDQDIEKARRRYAARTIRVRPRAARARARRGAGRRSA